MAEQDSALKHTLHFDGNADGIAWCLEGDPGSHQSRRHARVYRNRLSTRQSRYVALHVGIFWCIGTFRIRNGDAVRVMITDTGMLEDLKHSIQSDNQFIRYRTMHINLLTEQRDLTVSYHHTAKNPATKILPTKIA